jgi:hypothetical protein
MPGVNRAYTIVDVLQTIYGTATGSQSGVSTTAPTTPISLVGEADEQLTVSDMVTSVTRALPGWDQEVWGAFQWS